MYHNNMYSGFSFLPVYQFSNKLHQHSIVIVWDWRGLHVNKQSVNGRKPESRCKQNRIITVVALCLGKDNADMFCFQIVLENIFDDKSV